MGVLLPIPLDVWRLWDGIYSTAISAQALTAAGALIVAYFAGRTVYNLHSHPLSKYPGPRLAAVTDLWWVYASTSGRYPWIIESAIKRYGNVVRIAPNEVVFLTPQAAKDIYLAQEKNMELFVQVGYDALDTGDGGISGETNPVRHREIAKKLSPAFSTRNFRAKEAVIHQYINLFVQRMREHGGGERGAEMNKWTNWLGLDLSAALTYGADIGQVDKVQDSVVLRAALKTNLFITMSQITRKIRLLTPLMLFCFPPSILLIMPKLLKMHSRDIKQRIDRRGATQHLDYLEQLVPSDKLPPTDKSEIYHIENIAGQLLLAGWQPLTDQFYSIVLFILGEPGTLSALVDEIRSSFAKYEDITAETVAPLRYLHACTQESLRLHPETVDGLPRVSPGAVVDGEYIPQGVVCQISYFAASRSTSYFTDPRKFKPERWLKSDHPLYDPRYADDDLKASKPFSQGPRGCPGGAIASAVIKLWVAKVLWTFDLERGEKDGLPDFEKDFKFLTFWERPEFWVRFNSSPG